MDYDEKARDIAEYVNWSDTEDEAAEIIAAFGRECAAEAYEDALKVVCWTDASQRSLSEAETVLRKKIAALRVKP